MGQKFGPGLAGSPVSWSFMKQKLAEAVFLTEGLIGEDPLGLTDMVSGGFQFLVGS